MNTMHTESHFITLPLLCLAFTWNAAAQPFYDSPAVPPDSLTTALYDSFTAKLESAQNLARQGDYQAANHLYATSFEELKRYSDQRREHDARYLAEYYETEEKEQRIAFLNETLPLKQRQNLLLVLLNLITIITLILLLTFQKYRLRNIRQRAARRENETRLMELESEQRQLENRLQTLQTEQYQKELLAKGLLVNHKNKILDDLRLYFFHHPELNAHREELETILQNGSLETETPGFSTAVDDIHPAFYEKLQQCATNRLSPLDFEYCRMILMKMTSKEMAEILQVNPNTIRTGKYRLKLKLGLSKEEDLGEFIEQLGMV